MAASLEDCPEQRRPVDAALLLSAVATIAGLAWLARIALVAPELPAPTPVTYSPPAVLVSAPAVANPAHGESQPGWHRARVQGADGEGRAVIFDLVSSTDFGWERASIAVHALGDGKRWGLEAVLAGSPLAQTSTQASAIIAVGAAAFDEEAEMAGERARTLTGAVAGRQPVWALDLGRDLTPCVGCDAMTRNAQRPLMLIAVAASHEGAQVEAALRDALNRHASDWPSPARYQRFQLSRRS